MQFNWSGSTSGVRGPVNKNLRPDQSPVRYWHVPAHDVRFACTSGKGKLIRWWYRHRHHLSSTLLPLTFSSSWPGQSRIAGRARPQRAQVPSADGWCIISVPVYLPRPCSTIQKSTFARSGTMKMYQDAMKISSSCRDEKTVMAARFSPAWR